MEIGRQRIETKVQKSWGIRIFAVSINFLLIYLLVSIPVFLYGFLLGAGLIIILLAIRRVSKKPVKATDKKFKSTLPDLFNLAKRYTLIHKRYIIIATLGLTLSFIILSQILLTQTSYQQNNFNEFLQEREDDFFLRGPLMTFESWGQIDLTKFAEIQSYINETTNKYLKDLNLVLDFDQESLLTYGQFYNGSYTENPDGSRFIEGLYGNIQVWSQDLFSVIQSLPSVGGSLSINQPVMFIQEWVYQFTGNQEGNYSILVGEGWKDPSDNSTFNSVKLPEMKRLNFTSQDQDYFWRNELYNKFRVEFSDIMVFLPQTQYLDFLQAINSASDDPFSIEQRFSKYVYVKTPDITNRSPERLLNQLNKMVNEIQSEIREKFERQEIYLSFYSEFIYVLEVYIEEATLFRLYLVLVNIPNLVLSIFLVYFFINLVQQRKSRNISIMKMRGITNNQLTLSLFAEVIITGLIAAGLGMLISLPFTTLSFRSSGLFEFNAEPIDLIVPPDWWWKMPLIGILFSINLNLPSLSKLTKTKIEDVEVTIEGNEPIWQRLYLDVILFIIGTSFWLFVRTASGIDREVLGFLTFDVGSVFIFLLLVSIPFVSARLFSNLVGLISKLVWKVRGNLLALSTKNLRKNKFSSSRLVAVIVLAMVMSVVALSVPLTVEEKNIETAYYEVGADIYIANFNLKNATHVENINVEGIEAYTEIKSFEISVFSEDFYTELRLLAVNRTTFGDVGYWKNSYGDLENIMNSLSNESVAISQFDLNREKLKVGDIITIDNSITEIELVINSTMNYFPRIIENRFEFWGSGSREIVAEGVVDISFLDRYPVSVSDTGLLVRISDAANITSITEALRLNFENENSITIIDVNELIIQKNGSSEFRLLKLAMQNLLLLALIISVSGILYFTILTLSERNREIGTYRALGMIRNQIFFLLFIEAIVIILFSILFGLLFGWFITGNFIFIITDPVNNSIPPTRLLIPWFILSIYVITTITSMIVAAIYPAYTVANRETGSVLRDE